MECPSCGEDNLLGAKVCMSCGAKMTFEFAAPPVAAPAPAPAPAAPAAGPGMQQLICPLCSEPFQRVVGDAQAACDKCRKGFATAAGGPSKTFDPSGGGGTPEPAGAGGAASSSRARPGELDSPGAHSAPKGWGGDKAEQQFGELLGTATRRPPPIKKVKTFRWGLVLTPLILLGAAAGGWFYIQSLDRTRRLLDELQPTPAQLVVAPTPEITAALETSYKLRVYHGKKKAKFSDDHDAELDVHLRVVQTIGITLDRVGAAGAVCSVRSQVKIEDQSGMIDGKPASSANIHPHEDHNAGTRLVLSRATPPASVGGELALVGRDVPPFSTVGTLRSSSTSLKPGDTWSASVDLPFLADLRGGMIVVPFSCDFTYVGSGTRAGRECLGIHVVAQPPRTPPGPLSSFDQLTGEVRGALFFDAATGLLTEATMDVDLAAVSAGERDARLEVSGTVTSKTR